MLEVEFVRRKCSLELYPDCIKHMNNIFLIYRNFRVFRSNESVFAKNKSGKNIRDEMEVTLIGHFEDLHENSVRSIIGNKLVSYKIRPVQVLLEREEFVC